MPSKKPNLLRIGQVALQSGIPIKTLRYYDELGLLRSSTRSSGGFRLFSAEVFDCLILIKGAQYAGLNLQEIKELLQICEQRECPCGIIQQKLENMVQIIDQRINQLQFLQTQIERLIAEWEQRSQPSQSTIHPV